MRLPAACDTSRYAVLFLALLGLLALLSPGSGSGHASSIRTCPQPTEADLQLTEADFLQYAMPPSFFRYPLVVAGRCCPLAVAIAAAAAAAAAAVAFALFSVRTATLACRAADEKMTRLFANQALRLFPQKPG